MINHVVACRKTWCRDVLKQVLADARNFSVGPRLLQHDPTIVRARDAAIPDDIFASGIFSFVL